VGDTVLVLELARKVDRLVEVAHGVHSQAVLGLCLDGGATRIPSQGGAEGGRLVPQGGVQVLELVLSVPRRLCAAVNDGGLEAL
jgi:hypothetical protein